MRESCHFERYNEAKSRSENMIVISNSALRAQTRKEIM